MGDDIEMTMAIAVPSATITKATNSKKKKKKETKPKRKPCKKCQASAIKCSKCEAKLCKRHVEYAITVGAAPDEHFCEECHWRETKKPKPKQRTIRGRVTNEVTKYAHDDAGSDSGDDDSDFDAEGDDDDDDAEGDAVTLKDSEGEEEGEGDDEEAEEVTLEDAIPIRTSTEGDADLVEQHTVVMFEIKHILTQVGLLQEYCGAKIDKGCDYSMKDKVLMMTDKDILRVQADGTKPIDPTEYPAARLFTAKASLKKIKRCLDTYEALKKELDSSSDNEGDEKEPTDEPVVGSSTPASGEMKGKRASLYDGSSMRGAEPPPGGFTPRVTDHTPSTRALQHETKVAPGPGWSCWCRGDDAELVTDMQSTDRECTKCHAVRSKRIGRGAPPPLQSSSALISPAPQPTGVATITSVKMLAYVKMVTTDGEYVEGGVKALAKYRHVLNPKAYDAAMAYCRTINELYATTAAAAKPIANATLAIVPSPPTAAAAAPLQTLVTPVRAVAPVVPSPAPTSLASPARPARTGAAAAPVLSADEATKMRLERQEVSRQIALAKLTKSSLAQVVQEQASVLASVPVQSGLDDELANMNIGTDGPAPSATLPPRPSNVLKKRKAEAELDKQPVEPADQSDTKRGGGGGITSSQEEKSKTSKSVTWGDEKDAEGRVSVADSRNFSGMINEAKLSLDNSWMKLPRDMDVSPDHILRMIDSCKWPATGEKKGWTTPEWSVPIKDPAVWKRCAWLLLVISDYGWDALVKMIQRSNRVDSDRVYATMMEKRKDIMNKWYADVKRAIMMLSDITDTNESNHIKTAVAANGHGYTQKYGCTSVRLEGMFNDMNNGRTRECVQSFGDMMRFVDDPSAAGVKPVNLVWLMPMLCEPLRMYMTAFLTNSVRLPLYTSKEGLAERARVKTSLAAQARIKASMTAS